MNPENNPLFNTLKDILSEATSSKDAINIIKQYSENNHLDYTQLENFYNENKNLFGWIDKQKTNSNIKKNKEPYKSKNTGGRKKQRIEKKNKLTHMQLEKEYKAMLDEAIKEEQIIIKNDPKQMNVKQSIDSVSEQFENPEELLNYFKKQRRKKNNDFSKEDLYDIQNYIKKHEHEIKFKNNPNKTTLTDEIPKKTKLEEVSFEIPKDLPIDKTPEKPLSNNKQKRAKQKQKKELFKNSQKKYYSDPEYRKRKIAAKRRIEEISEYVEKPEDLLVYFKDKALNPSNDFSKLDYYDIEEYVYLHKNKIKFKDTSNNTEYEYEKTKKTKRQQLGEETIFRKNQEKYINDPEYKYRNTKAKVNIDNVSEQFENTEELLNHFKKQAESSTSKFSKKDYEAVEEYISTHTDDINFKHKKSKATQKAIEEATEKAAKENLEKSSMKRIFNKRTFGIVANGYFAISDYKEAREEGKGVIGAGLKSAGLFVAGEALGGAMVPIMLAKSAPSMAVSAIEGMQRMTREMNSMSRLQTFGDAQFQDTQQLATMRQAGMELAKMSQYNLQQSIMGNEAQSMHRL